jgi:hypothetical protein
VTGKYVFKLYVNLRIICYASFEIKEQHEHKTINVIRKMGKDSISSSGDDSGNDNNKVGEGNQWK